MFLFVQERHFLGFMSFYDKVDLSNHFYDVYSLPLKFLLLSWIQMLMEEKKYHEELKREVRGAQYSTISSDIEVGDAEEEAMPDLQQHAEDEDNMTKVGMSRKKRKLITAMEVRKISLYISFSLGFLH